MAETTTPRLGLSVYSSGNDLHPDREKFNAQQRLLDSILATARQGTLAERPAAGTGCAVYWATDNARLYFDDGTAWRDVNTTGGGGAGAPISVGGTATEGSSARAARADHTHALPLATATAPGALSSADKKKLDAATSAATPNTLMMTDANGRSQTAAPVNAADAANKSYVDQAASNASNLTTGTVLAARLPLVTSSVAGAMSAADKEILDAATHLNSASTLVKRFSNGSAQFSSVWLQSVQANVANAATRKDYVDSQIDTRAPASHTHSASDIDSGVLAVERLPEATQTVRGTMSAADKKKLDSASAASTPSTLMSTDASGRFSVNAPTASGHAANKGYVDGLIAQQVTLGGELGNADLNTITTPGDYYASGGANATTANNYPVNGAVGTLSVRRFHSSSIWVIQVLNVWNKNDVWVRSTNSATGWTAWSLQATDSALQAGLNGKSDTGHKHSGADITTGTISPLRIANATASLDGLMPKADKAKLDAAMYAPTANAIPMVNAQGNFKVPYAFVEEGNAQSALSHSLTRKDYVDAKFADIFLGTEIPDSANLNNYTTPGIYHNSTNASVATGSNYPSGSAGKLEVVKSAGGTMIYQLWTDYNSAGRIFYRTKYGSSWYSWKELVNDQTVSALSYAASTGPGVMSNFDSYTTPGPYLNVGSSTVQPYFLEVFSQPDGGLMQRRTTTTGSSPVAVRFRRSGTWTAWSVV